MSKCLSPKGFCDGPLNCYGFGHCRHLDSLAWDLAQNTIGKARDCKPPSIGMCPWCGQGLHPGKRCENE